MRSTHENEPKPHFHSATHNNKFNFVQSLPLRFKSWKLSFGLHTNYYNHDLEDC